MTRDKIRYSTQVIEEDDILAVVNALRSDFLTQGPNVVDFEDQLAAYCGSKFAVACSSATAGLHIAYLALGMARDTIMWTTPITFAATVNSAKYCGADVRFVDIDPITKCMCLVDLKNKLIVAEKNGTLPDIVTVVHFGGYAPNMKEFHQLSKKFNFRLVEDASHALGAQYQGGGHVGNCTYSDLTIFSFHPVKMITTGEGGAVLSNNSEIIEKMRLLRSHGITRDVNKFKFKTKSTESWYYEQQMLGFNYRMNEVSAALGISQMSKLDSFVNRRRQIANYYRKELDQRFYTLPSGDCYKNSSWHLYVIELSKNDGSDRTQLMRHLLESNIETNVHYIPVYKLPYHFTNCTYLPNAENYYQRCLSIPIHPKLNDEHLKRIVETFNGFYE